MDKKLKHKDVIKLVKRNEIKEISEKTRNYFIKNTENTIIAAIAAAVIIIGVPLFMNSRKAADEKAQQALSRANNIYGAPVSEDPQMAMYGYFPDSTRKYETAASSYMEVLQAYKGTKAEALAYLGLAASNFNTGKYQDAETNYRLFTDKFPKHPLIAEAYNGLAYSLLESGKIQEAAAAWEKVVKEMKNSAIASSAMFNLASVYETLGKKEESKKLFEEASAGGDSYFAPKAAGKK